MGALAQQLASRLRAGCLRLQQRAVAIEPGAVKLLSGEEVRARHVVVATDQANAAKLLPEIAAESFRATTCFYFAAEKPPIAEPVLVLNGDSRGPINNLCVPSAVAPSYAPRGVHLVSASVVGESALSSDELLPQVRNHLEEWFGDKARAWRHLKTYWIPQALPQIAPRQISAAKNKNEVRPGIYLCGDYCETASINGALASGRKAAEEILSKA
jgi:protoporphyrinogen oxidase